MIDFNFDNVILYYLEQFLAMEKMKKNYIERELNKFLEVWDYDKISEFFRFIEPLIKLYDISEQEDWVATEVGEDSALNVRLIRTVYIMSRLSHEFAATLVKLNCQFPRFFERLEHVQITVENGGELPPT